MAQRVNEPVLYTLITPVNRIEKDSAGVVTEVPVEVIKLRPMLAGDLRVTDGCKGQSSMALALIARLSDQPETVIDRLSMADFTALSGILADFLPSGLPTGDA